MAKSPSEPDSFVLDLDRSALTKLVQAQMLNDLGKAPGPAERIVIPKIAEITARITEKEIASVKNRLLSDPNWKPSAEEISKGIAANVTKELKTASTSGSPENFVDVPLLGKQNAVKIVATLTGEEKFYSNAQKMLESKIKENIEKHPQQFAALKPQPPKAPTQAEKSWMPSLVPAAAAADLPPPAPAAPPKQPEAAPPAPPAAQPAPSPAPEQTTVVAEAPTTKPAPPASKPAAPATGEPTRLIPDTETAPAAPPAPPTAAPTSVPSLSSIFTSISDKASDPGQRDAYITLMQNVLSQPNTPGQGINGTIEEYIRGAITASGKDAKDFSDDDIKAFATQIKEASREWINKHQSELKSGNLSAGRISALSNELAMGVRVRMTPEKVGAFATKEMFIIDKRDIITGVDAEGNPTRPFDMNIQSMAEAAIAGAAGDEAAKKRYKEQVAYEESHRAFYASEEAQDGVTAGMATEAARHRMRGKYSGNTQAAVEQMTSHAFQPSSWFSKIIDYFMAFIGALFGGNLGQLMVSFQDGSFSAHRREKEASGKNFNLYREIMESSPKKLGYEGDEAGFAQWKQELATDVTGIHFDASRRTYTDINRSTGATTGIAAISQGLTPDGMSRVPGMEDVMGGRHIYMERSQTPQRTGGRERGGAMPIEYDGGGAQTGGDRTASYDTSGEYDGTPPSTPYVPPRPTTGRGAAGAGVTH